MSRRDRFVDRLAGLEERVRVRLHQAANRMEDADPIEARALLGVIRVFNGVDRLIGFREQHQARVQRETGVRLPLPPVRPPDVPWLDGLDKSRFSAQQRVQLRQLYDAWVATLPGPPQQRDHAGGGYTPSPPEPLRGAWAQWWAVLAPFR